MSKLTYADLEKYSKVLPTRAELGGVSMDTGGNCRPPTPSATFLKRGWATLGFPGPRCPRGSLGYSLRSALEVARGGAAVIYGRVDDENAPPHPQEPSGRRRLLDTISRLAQPRPTFDGPPPLSWGRTPAPRRRQDPVLPVSSLAEAEA